MVLKSPSFDAQGGIARRPGLTGTGLSGFTAAVAGVRYAVVVGRAGAAPRPSRGLSSRRRPLGVPRKPSGACLQQGLHALAPQSIRQVLRSLGQECQEALQVQLVVAFQHNSTICDPCLQGSAFLTPGKKPESAPPAHAGLTLLVRDRDPDVIRM